VNDIKEALLSSWWEEIISELKISGDTPNLKEYIKLYENEEGTIQVKVGLLRAVFQHDAETTIHLLEHQARTDSKLNEYTRSKHLSRNATRVMSELSMMNHLLISRETSAYFFLKRLLKDFDVQNHNTKS